MVISSPVEFWAKISQFKFPCEIIVDLEDDFADKKPPKELEGLHIRGDKLILSFPFEFEQVLRAPVEIEDVAVILDGDITDTKRIGEAVELLNILGEHLSKLSDYTFTFWVNQFTDALKPPAGKGGTIAVDLDGITPVLIVEVEDDHTHLQELASTHPLKKEFENATGITLKLSHHAKALIRKSEAEQT